MGGQRVVLVCVSNARVGQQVEHVAYYLHSWGLPSHLSLPTTERLSAKHRIPTFLVHEVSGSASDLSYPLTYPAVTTFHQKLSYKFKWEVTESQ